MEYFAINEPLVIFYVTKYDSHWGGPQPSIESGWKISRDRAERHPLFLARDDDRVVGAYRPIPGTWRRGGGDWKPDRWFFDVRLADDVWDDYVGKLVPPGLIGPSNRPVIRYAAP